MIAPFAKNTPGIRVRSWFVGLYSRANHKPVLPTQNDMGPQTLGCVVSFFQPREGFFS